MTHNPELEAYKKRVHAKLVEEADKRGWREDFDDILEKLDLPRRSRHYVIELRVYADFSSQDDAENFADNLISKIAENGTVGEVEYTNVYENY